MPVTHLRLFHSSMEEDKKEVIDLGRCYIGGSQNYIMLLTDTKMSFVI